MEPDQTAARASHTDQPGSQPGAGPDELMAAARYGDRKAIGRLLTLVERGGEPARRVSKLAFAPPGDDEQVVGVTGAPGAGKSTLTDRLIASARAGGHKVGVLAVDPSSPFSGGAILGDRIRMQGHALDDGVFIRSMATRGHQGGLAVAAPEAIRVLVASGLPLVLVETVGVGQVEVEVAGEADSTVVVVNPGWGDAVQASKAGLLEVADIFVVNKADRPGVAETKRDLENMLDMDPSMGEWRPPVLLTTAADGEGVDAVWEAVETHRQFLVTSGQLAQRRRRRLADELARVLTWRIERDVRTRAGGKVFDGIKAQVLAHELDPYEAADRILAAG